MADYEKMYFGLAAAVADAIERLTAAQLKGEEQYLSEPPVPLTVLEPAGEE